MKIDVDSHGLRVTGKAWQVRACLRSLATHPLTLKEYLNRRLKTPKNRTLMRVR
ncbi:Z-ring formation inhibitor MciZ [Staphylospora marina]|uniref:Z-ring formation inhibitor MciZ n=1 Tax=Staphylospora marina TaxID=2490858 RepID=UPI000F5BCADF|nr:Z-ring formation inhibitor MciZ [Staphylospora marina]